MSACDCLAFAHINESLTNIFMIFACVGHYNVTLINLFGPSSFRVERDIHNDRW